MGRGVGRAGRPQDMEFLPSAHHHNFFDMHDCKTAHLLHPPFRGEMPGWNNSQGD